MTAENPLRNRQLPAACVRREQFAAGPRKPLLKRGELSSRSGKLQRECHCNSPVRGLNPCSSTTRLGTHLSPCDYDRYEGQCGEVVPSEAVVSCGDAPPVL